MRRYLLAVSAAVLLGILIASPPLAYADAVDDAQYDLLNSGGAPAPSQFYIGFVDIAQAGAVLTPDNEYYYFRMVLWDTPEDWLWDSWVPAFADSPVQIERVRYQWNFFDSAFNQVGGIRVIFRAGGWFVNALVCVSPVPDLPDQSNADCIWGNFTPLTLGDLGGYDTSIHTLALSISAEQFVILFPNAVYWRAVANAFLANGVAQIRDRTTRESLPVLPAP